MTVAGVVVGAVLLGVAGVILLSSVEEGDAPETPAAVHNSREPGEVSEHWTEERMNEASPY